MKKTFFLYIALILNFAANCQTKTATESHLEGIDSTINLDLLNAPASPAFNLLGISPSSIERPTDLNSFRLSIQNATSNFSKFPSNYSAEFSPASIFGVKSQTLDKFNSTDFKNVFWQSFSVSFGLTRTDKNDTESPDSLSSTKLGLGIKFAIIRPHWNDSTQRYIDSIYFYQDKMNKTRENIFLNDKEIKDIESLIVAVSNSSLPQTQKEDSIRALLNRKTEKQRSLAEGRIKYLGDSTTLNKLDGIALKSLVKLANGLKITRKGVFLDFASGFVLDFPGDRFDNSLIAKAGAWLTGGYEGGKNISILAIARYLYQPDKIFADDNGKISSKNISTFDAGIRIIAGGGENKFSASTEALYRNVINKNTIPSNWRIVFNASYDLGHNKMITLALGKNFDGTISKSGNLISALNFIAGFGSSKKIKPKS